MSDAAITTIVTGMVTVATIVVGFLTMWVKLRYGTEKADRVESKIDNNTMITRATSDVARGARTAAVEAASTIKEKLNGGIDAAIEPLRKMIEENSARINAHIENDERNFAEIKTALTVMSNSAQNVRPTR